MKREPTYRTALVIVVALVFVAVCGCSGFATRTALGQSHHTLFGADGELEHTNYGTAELTLRAEVKEDGTWTYELTSKPSAVAGDAVMTGWAHTVEAVGRLASTVESLAGLAVADRADARANETTEAAEPQ